MASFQTGEQGRTILRVPLSIGRFRAAIPGSVLQGSQTSYRWYGPQYWVYLSPGQVGDYLGTWCRTVAQTAPIHLQTHCSSGSHGKQSNAAAYSILPSPSRVTLLHHGNRKKSDMDSGKQQWPKWEMVVDCSALLVAPLPVAPATVVIIGATPATVIPWVMLLRGGDFREGCNGSWRI